MTEPFVVRRETQIAAPPATVFAFLTDPEKIMSWMGTEAKTEMHPGGLYLLKGVNGRVARGAFREVVPVHRLAYSFGWEGSEEVPLLWRNDRGLGRRDPQFELPSSSPFLKNPAHHLPRTWFSITG